jgi:hypothetical protein
LKFGISGHRKQALSLFNELKNMLDLFLVIRQIMGSHIPDYFIVDPKIFMGVSN